MLLAVLVLKPNDAFRLIDAADCVLAAPESQSTLGLRDLEHHARCRQSNYTLTSAGQKGGAVSLALVTGQVPGSAEFGQNPALRDR